MGSLDDATSDNNLQETTLATIRSVSGDWDNNNVSLSAINASTVPGISAFDSKLFDTVSNGFPLLYIIGFLHGRKVAENGGHILRHI